MMGPAKAARNILFCDGCGHLIQTGATYHIDAHGYLVCTECAKAGDLSRTAAV